MPVSYTHLGEGGHQNNPGRTAPGSPVLFGRDYFDALLHLPEGSGGSAVLRAHPQADVYKRQGKSRLGKSLCGKIKNPRSPGIFYFTAKAFT